MTKIPMILVAFCVLGPACNDFRDCSTVDVSGINVLPIWLSETGLYSDISTETLSESVIGFEPQYPLWTDGAEKQRWLLLPDGTQVDTEDDETWIFPTGTKLFKTFIRDGVRIETRVILKTEAEWVAATYLWTSDDSDAKQIESAISNASNTEHDIPSAAECHACHGGRDSFALGFSAVQLDQGTKSNLHKLGLFTNASTAEVQLDDALKDGLGVLHGNCSHCHNASRANSPQATDCYDPGTEENFDLTLPANLNAISDIPALQTARHKLLKGEIIERMSQRNTSNQNPSMPPLGTELVDEDGLAAVQALVDALNAEGH